MVDFTKCMGGDCTEKEKCLRYTAESSVQWQAWFVAYPIRDNRVCTMLKEAEKP